MTAHTADNGTETGLEYTKFEKVTLWTATTNYAGKDFAQLGALDHFIEWMPTLSNLMDAEGVQLIGYTAEEWHLAPGAGSQVEK
jgi:hypothetical protein